MKTISLLGALFLFGLAYFLLRLNFASGPIEIGRGLMGAYVLPFTPLLVAMVFVGIGTLTAFVAAFSRR